MVRKYSGDSNTKYGPTDRYRTHYCFACGSEAERDPADTHFVCPMDRCDGDSGFTVNQDEVEQYDDALDAIIDDHQNRGA